MVLLLLRHLHHAVGRPRRQAVELKPDWPKGYTRVGAAAFHLRDWPAATKAYEKGAPPEPAHALSYIVRLPFPHP